MTSVALKRVERLTTWIVVLTAIVGVVGVLSTLFVTPAVERGPRLPRRPDRRGRLRRGVCAVVAARIRPGRGDDRARRADHDLDVPPGLQPPGAAARTEPGHRAGRSADGSCRPAGPLHHPLPHVPRAVEGVRPDDPGRRHAWKTNPVGTSSRCGGCCTAWHRSRSAIAQGLYRVRARNFNGDIDTLAEAIDDRLAMSFVSSVVAATAAVALHRDGPPTLRPPPSADRRIGAADIETAAVSGVVELGLDLGEEPLDLITYIGGRPAGEALARRSAARPRPRRGSGTRRSRGSRTDRGRTGSSSVARDSCITASRSRSPASCESLVIAAVSAVVHP